MTALGIYESFIAQVAHFQKFRSSAHSLDDILPFGDFEGVGVTHDIDTAHVSTYFAADCTLA